MRRRNVPCSPCSGGSSGSCGCCSLKEKLRILWDRTIGSILKINDITPDGDGNFTIEAGSNIAISERGTGNGIRIDTTGGVSYYESGDSYVNVDNNDLEISVNVGTGGLAKDDDLQTVAGAVADILDGTSTVPKATDATNATNAQYLGSISSNVGSDTKPIKIVNGQAVAVTDELQTKLITTKGNIAVDNYVFSTNSFMYYMKFGNIVIVTYVLYPLTPGVQTAGRSPFPPTETVYYSSVESNASACRSSVITQTGDVKVTVVSGDTNISGFVVYSI